MVLNPIIGVFTKERGDKTSLREDHVSMEVETRGLKPQAKHSEPSGAGRSGEQNVAQSLQRGAAFLALGNVLSHLVCDNLLCSHMKQIHHESKNR